MNDKIIIGITGGIGSGKSAVRNYLKSLGENVICADKISRNIVMPGKQGNDEIRRVFGNDYFIENGELDRKKLAGLIFGEEEKLKTLNGILHPIIVSEIFKEADKLIGRVFIEAPLLIQTGMNKRVDYVWLLTTDINIRISRVMRRDGLSEEQVLKRIESQLSDEDMAAFSDEIIENNGSLDDLHKRISQILLQPEYTR
jgi:dephospho-CoA kinase